MNLFDRFRRTFAARAACWLALLAIGSLASADEPVWKVGLKQIKITPDRPVPMAGYAARTKPFEEVEADLYAKALALEDTQGNRAVLVTSDLIGFRAAVTEPICEKIVARTGLKREQILLTASHTHAGPMLGLQPASDEAESLRTVEYTQRLVDLVAEVASGALAVMQPARLSLGEGVAPFAMNRREFRKDGVVLGVNPRGLVDRSVPVLRIDGQDNLPRAVLFGASVHNTTLGGDNYRVCGDYAGFAQAYVEQQYPAVPAMFLLGCAGDANPYPRGTMDHARKHGETLGQEVCRVMKTKLRPIGGPLTIAFERVALPLEPAPPREELELRAAGKTRFAPFTAKQMLAALDRGETLPTEYECPFTVWQLGDDLTLVGLPGEVVVDYLKLIERAIGPNQLWVVAYANDVFGYLPSARVLEEGGYETRGLYHGGIGYFAPSAQEVVVEHVRELARQAGRRSNSADAQ
ncbi:MAG TPA: neutral/alkaline non-lysosomal ceramidase N-terminal domain-containing protein [Pirellulales bacterium]|nr:neutral/alkaline non-lysosomal ceramidase N-terminal domain-containing protein [Pirellulales bacterium]